MLPKYPQWPLRMFCELLDLWATLHSGTLATVCGQKNRQETGEANNKGMSSETRIWTMATESCWVKSHSGCSVCFFFVFPPLGSSHWHSLTAIVYFWVLTVLLPASCTTTSPEKTALLKKHHSLRITWVTKGALQEKKQTKRKKSRGDAAWFSPPTSLWVSPCYRGTFQSDRREGKKRTKERVMLSRRDQD